MKTQHTPGPWNISDKNLFVVCANIPSGSVSIETPVAEVCNSGALRWREEEEANARLIAAAPELLEALEGLVKYWEWSIKDPSFKEYVDAKAAIKKAKGE